ncbi:MAG: amidase domain-containing protein [Caulobacteraceae bacterium]
MKMRLKAVLMVLLASLLIYGNMWVFASGDDKEEKRKNNPRKYTEEKLSEKDIQDFEQAIKEKDKLIRENSLKLDKETGSIINKYAADKSKNYEDIAASDLKEEKISAMYAIIDVYPNVEEKEQKLLKYYFNKYSPYAGDEYLKEYGETNFAAPVSILSADTGNYDRSLAVTYAYDHYDSYSSDYPDMNLIGGDCANFISQCLHEGGIPMDNAGGWYIYPKVSNPVNRVADINEFNANWDAADPSPWVSAVEFNTYWGSSAVNTYEYDDQYYVDNTATVYREPLYTGDAVQLLKQFLWWYEGYHTMIITSYGTDDEGDSDYLVSYHTNDQVDKSLDWVTDQFMGSGGSYKVKFFDIN